MEHDTTISRSSWSISQKFSPLVVLAAFLSGIAIGTSECGRAADASRYAKATEQGLRHDTSHPE